MLTVQVFRATECLFSGTATQVVIPGEGGELAILGCHAPTLCVLTEGELHIDATHLAVRRGIARVARNTVTILAT